MRKGKSEKNSQRKSFSGKAVALMLACGLLIGGVVGGTVAWLTADGGSVENTFTESDIDITLSEDGATDGKQEFKMIPGWKIDKKPKVTVDADSEDCWLFVKITESATPDLDAYISYAIAEGWEIVEPINTNAALATISTVADEIVIGRKVYKDDTTKTFDILGAGNYTDSMGTADNTEDDVTIQWSANQVCVKPSVTEDMMEAITGTEKTQPILSFTAYAVQLFKTNSDNNKSTTTDEFTAAEAWARVSTVTSGS